MIRMLANFETLMVGLHLADLNDFSRSNSQCKVSNFLLLNTPSFFDVFLILDIFSLP